MLVGILHGVANRANKLRGLARRQRSVGHSRREAAAVDKAHREIMLPLVLADLEDRHDARMIEIGRGLGFRMESLDVGRRGQLARENHLHRDDAD